MADVIDRIGFLKAALSEAGYPNAIVDGTQDEPAIRLADPVKGVPDEVCWKAHRLLALTEGATDHPCWECWSHDVGDDCAEGNCHAG